MRQDYDTAFGARNALWCFGASNLLRQTGYLGWLRNCPIDTECRGLIVHKDELSEVTGILPDR